MACNVVATSVAVTQIAGGAATKIVVSGTARDCAAVPPSFGRPEEVRIDVTVAVLVGGQPDPTQSATVTATIAPPPATGVDAPWSVEAKGLPPVPCGGRVRVAAACRANPSCASETDFTVDCGSCPTVEFEAEVAPGCNADGARTVTFRIGLGNLPPAGTPVVGVIHLGDGTPGSASLPVLFPGPEWTTQQNDAVGTYTFDYAPGSYPNVSFETTFPTACAGRVALPASQSPLEIGSCPRTDCPSAVTLEVRNSAGAVVATGPGAPCLPAGDYVVAVTAPAGAGRSFVWSVDGTVDPAPNVSGVNRSSYARAVAAGAQPLASAAVSPPRCGAPPSGAVALTGCGASNPPPPPPPPPPPRGPGRAAMPPLCEIARIAGLALFIVGCVLILAGACSGAPALAGVGVALALAGALVLGLWAAFCAPFNGGCLLLQRLIEAFELAAIGLPIIAALFALLGMAPCAIGVVIDLGLVGATLAILNRIFRAVGCRFV
ncbi:hypothetical protein [Methylocella sp.]|uniref:hypothetical protein n=1 Tax=Methylocella sp. TaxID=1978226 RepID=UPI003782D996